MVDSGGLWEPCVLGIASGDTFDTSMTPTQGLRPVNQRLVGNYSLDIVSLTIWLFSLQQICKQVS